MHTFVTDKQNVSAEMSNLILIILYVSTIIILANIFSYMTKDRLANSLGLAVQLKIATYRILFIYFQSTYCNTIVKHCESVRRTVRVINMDPAAEHFDYPVHAGRSHPRRVFAPANPSPTLTYSSDKHYISEVFADPNPHLDLKEPIKIFTKS